MALHSGQTLGRYQILEPLGTGGMAVVYKAYQPSLEREVALKVLRGGYAQDKEFVDRFEREARSIARMRHPNIVQVFDFETIEGRPVLAMEFLEGGTLKERLASLAGAGRRIDRAEAVRILGEVASALSYAHDRGIVHRDVKPANVMLSDGRAVVTDFGIAKILEGTSHTQTGVGIGTPEYMAPEQGQDTKGVDHRADIYSLGVMAYEMLTGRLPFTADTPVAIVLAHMSDPLPLPRSIDATLPVAMELALLKALAKNPADRFARATELAAALAAGLPDAEEAAPTRTMVVPAQRASSPASPLTRPPLLAAAALVALLVVVSVAFAVTRGAGDGSASIDPIPRGALYYEAKLDGTPAGVRPGSLRKNFGGSATTTDPNAVVLRTPPGAIEIANDKPNSQLEFAFDAPLKQNYVAKLEMQLTAGSKALVQLTFRRATGSYWFNIAPSDGAVTLSFNPGTTAASTVRVGDRAIVAGLAEGRKVTIDVAIEDSRFTFFADGRQVLQVSDTRLPATPQPLYISNYATTADATGTVRITSAQFFELKPGVIVQAPTAAPAATIGARPFESLHSAAFYEAKFDGVAVDLTSFGPADRVKVGSGALTMVTPDLITGPSTLATPQVPPATQYAIDFTVQFATGSEGRFSTCVRRVGAPGATPTAGSPTSTYCLALTTTPEVAELQYGEPTGSGTQQRTETIGPAVAVAGLRTRPVRVAIVVDRQSFAVFIDDMSKPTISTTDSRLVTPTSPVGFLFARLQTNPNTGGTVTIRDLKIYRPA